MQTTVRLASRIPRDGSVVFAALSGIRYPALCRMGCALTLITLRLSFVAPLTSRYSTRSDVEPYEQCGASAVLVGETLMRAADPAAAIRSLVGVATAVRDPVGKPLVKVSDDDLMASTPGPRHLFDGAYCYARLGVTGLRYSGHSLCLGRGSGRCQLHRLGVCAFQEKMRCKLLCFDHHLLARGAATEYCSHYRLIRKRPVERSLPHCIGSSTVADALP